MDTRQIRSPQCNDTRKCFAANNNGGWRFCRILETTYERDGDCPFCKVEDADFINAKYHKMILERGLRYRQIAAVMGISPEMLSGIMSKPLSEKNVIKIKQAVKELSREKEKWT